MLVRGTKQTSACNTEADSLWKRVTSYQHFHKKGLDRFPAALEGKRPSVLTAVKTDEDSGLETLWLLKNIDSLSAIKNRLKITLYQILISTGIVQRTVGGSAAPWISSWSQPSTPATGLSCLLSLVCLHRHITVVLGPQINRIAQW